MKTVLIPENESDVAKLIKDFFNDIHPMIQVVHAITFSDTTLDLSIAGSEYIFKINIDKQLLKPVTRGK